MNKIIQASAIALLVTAGIAHWPPTAAGQAQLPVPVRHTQACTKASSSPVSATAPADKRLGRSYTPQEIDDLIKKLGDRQYQARHEATDRLLEIGLAAKAALQQASTGGDPEARLRAAGILKGLVQREYLAKIQSLRKNILWTFELTKGPAGPPAIADGKVIFLGMDQQLHAIDAATGKETWNHGTFTLKVGQCDTPIVADGTVFISDRADSLYALSLASGKRLWRHEHQTDPGPPCAGGGLVYVGSDGDDLRLLDARTGGEKRRISSSKDYGVRPLLVDGTLFLANAIYREETPDAPAGDAPVVRAFSVPDAKLLWQFETRVPCSHMVAGQILYFKASLVVGALNAKTGKSLWTVDLPAANNQEAQLALADGTLYATCPDLLIALDAKTGEKNWSAKFAPDESCPPGPDLPHRMIGLAIDAANVYVARPDGIHAIAVKTGEKSWVLRTTNKITVGPVIANGILYFGTSQERNPEDGEKDFDDAPGMHALNVGG